MIGYDFSYRKCVIERGTIASLSRIGYRGSTNMNKTLIHIDNNLYPLNIDIGIHSIKN